MPKYSLGKQTIPIDFETFDKAMQHGIFKNYTHKSFLVFLYWFGVRRSEALERIKEDFRIEDDSLIVNAPAKKGGERESLEVDINLPYVNLIIERIGKTKRHRRLWNFSERTAVRIVKRALGQKYYPHFLRLNRATKFLEDPETTIPEMMAWFGWKEAKTVSSYIGHSRRYIQKQKERLRRELEKK